MELTVGVDRHWLHTTGSFAIMRLMSKGLILVNLFDVRKNSTGGPLLPHYRKAENR